MLHNNKAYAFLAFLATMHGQGGRPSLDLNIFGEKTSAHQETPGLHNDVCTAAPLLRTSSVPPEHLAEIEGNPDNHISESFFGGPEALDWSATKDNSHPLGAIKNNHSAAILGEQLVTLLGF